MTNNHLKPKNYTQLNQLGQGRYAAVYLGINNKTNEEVAIKIIDKQKIKNENPMFIKNELSIMKRFQPCKNIVKILDYIEDSENAKFILEYLDGFNLQREYYERHVNKKIPMSFEEKKTIMLGVINGLKNLHAQDIYHGDLKPENIVLVKGEVYLIDFGCSFICENGVYEAKEFYMRGTPGFGPPETTCFSNLENMIIPEKVDVWALCCVLFYLFSGRLPFDCDFLSSGRLYKTVSDLFYEKDGVPENIIAICEKVFVDNIDERLSLREFEKMIVDLQM
ncbi:hypothetical protein BDAP_002863 [Binucleata daphniae]